MSSKKSSGKSNKSVAKVVSSTAVRNTAIPKVSAAAPVAAAPTQITHDMIAARAYEIWSNRGGDEQSNWVQAESELRTAAELRSNGNRTRMRRKRMARGDESRAREPLADGAQARSERGGIPDKSEGFRRVLCLLLISRLMENTKAHIVACGVNRI